MTRAMMPKLGSRGLMIATGSVLALAALLIAWQLAGRSGSKSAATQRPDNTRDTGVVTRAVAPSASPAAATLTPPPVTNAASAAAVSASPASLPSPPAAKVPTPPTTSTPTPKPAPESNVRHPVPPPSARAPALLPHEVNAAAQGLLGPRAMARHLWVDPLVQRFVNTVDGLGRAQPPSSQWLLQPAPGTLRLTQRRGQTVLASANAQRYQASVAWLSRLNTAQALRLYQRLYPLLQQAYVESGHAGQHFNDRFVEVLDQMLATPTPRGPLRLVPTATPHADGRPRYEFADPALAALSTGQKALLRLSPEQARQLKAQMRALRAGLVKLSPRR